MKVSKRSKKQKNKSPIPVTGRATAVQTALRHIPLFNQFQLQKGMLYYDANLAMSAPGTGAATGYVFSANGMFDPDITGTGHQPMGFDTMMSFYDQYTVVKAAITVTPVPMKPMRFGVYIADDFTPQTDARKLMENGLVNTRMYGGLTSASTANVVFAGTSITLDVGKYFGRQNHREMMEDDRLFGTAAANPLEQVYFIIGCWQTDADGTTAAACAFDVLIEYDVLFWEPRKEPLSVSSRVDKVRLRKADAVVESGKSAGEVVTSVPEAKTASPAISKWLGI